MTSTSTDCAPSATERAVHRYFEVSLYLLVVAGFITLAGTGRLDPPSLILAGAGLAIRGLFLARGFRFVLSEQATTLLTLVYVGFYAADFFLLSRNFVGGTVHLVLFATVAKIFSIRRERDYGYLAVLAFLMVLAAAVLTVDSVFLFGFSLFLLIAVTTFILMEMRRSAASAPVQARSDAATSAPMAWWLVGFSPALLLLIMAVATAIFFLIPRVSGGYLSAYAPHGQLATGFSDNVRLGRIGEIQQSNSVVMHIQIDGDRTGAYDLKWRGIALSLFDGHIWSNPLPQIQAPRAADGRFFLLTGNAAEPVQFKASRPLHYRVLMEPIGSDVFFLAGRGISLSGPYRQLAIDSGASVYNADRERSITTYDATSDLLQPTPAALRRAPTGYPPALGLRYLQLPAIDQRVHALAQQITADATNAYDKALAVEQYLRAHYAYTLQLGNREPKDPIADFLFERKAGHCEYFASSMAILLRAVGVPTRVINGFRGGEFNDLTGSYLVRGRDAHSWVEVYFPGNGWVTFDPTPAAPAAARGSFSRLMLYVDAAAEFWREWVINYDVLHQHTLQENATSRSRAAWERLRAWSARQYQSVLQAIRNAQRHAIAQPRKPATIAIALVLLAVLLFNLPRMVRRMRERRLLHHPRVEPRRASTVWYERMLRIMDRHGWRKSAHVTPAEFSRSIADAELRPILDRFTDCYEHARFGHSESHAEQLAAIYEELARRV